MVKSTKPPKTVRYDTDEEPEVELDDDRFHWLSLEEGRKLLDEQAQKHLNMSGEEFRHQYRSGAIKDSDGPEVFRISFLVPFAEGPENGQEEHSR